MPEITIQELSVANTLKIAIPFSDYAFRPSPQAVRKVDTATYKPLAEARRTFALYADDAPQAVAGLIPMQINVRGHIFSMGGVGAVTTAPEARRKGYARALMQHILAACYESGSPVSTLYPFRESFYQRLGYVGFPQIHDVQFDPTALGELLRTPPNGTVRRMALADGLTIYMDYLHDILAQTHGFGLLPQSFYAYRAAQKPLWLAIAEAHGQVQGVMAYSISGHGGTLHAPIFLYRQMHGRMLLLHYLAQHIDQITRARLSHLSPGDLPELWWHDLDARIVSPRERDGFLTPMGRVISVADLDGLPVGPGAFRATILDEQCPWNNGSYAFEASGGRLQVQPTRHADVELHIQGLSALVFTGLDPAELYWRGWGDPHWQLQDTLRSMFPRALPFLFSEF